MELIKGATAIQKAITSIGVRGGKLDNDIQHVALSVLAHGASEENGGCGDTTLLDKLVQAMPKGSRKLALVEWALAFGQVRKLDSKSEAAAIKAGRVFGFDKTRKLDLQGATDKPWHECRKEPSPMTAFDVHSAMKSVMARMKSASAAGLSIENKALALADAKALVEILSAQ